MASDLPFPEPLPALQAQFHLLEEGRKRVVLVPHFQPRMQTSATTGARHTPLGTFFFKPDLVTAEEIDRAVLTDTVGELLGYGIPRKPEAGDRAVVLRMADGGEKIAVVCDAFTEPKVRAALDQFGNFGERLSTENPLTVVQDRLRYWSNYFKLQPPVST